MFSKILVLWPYLNSCISKIFIMKILPIKIYIIRSCKINYYTPAPRRGRGVWYTVFTSLRPSKIFFVAFFSVTVDGRNLIFGHNRYIGIPYVGSVFGPVRFLLPVCRLSWFLYTLNKRFWTFQIPTSCLPT